MHVLIGPPGSGKTTYAAKMIAGPLDPHRGPSRVAHVSADHAFMVPDERGALVYRFDPSRLGEVHATCVRAFIAALAAPRAEGDGPLTVIVDNTNTTALEIAPYYAIAKAFDADVVLVHFDTHVSTCIARNVHGVPPAEICRSWDRARDFSPPPYWDVSESVRKDLASYAAHEGDNDPDCERTIAKVLSSAGAYECTFPDGTVKMLSWVELHVGLKTSAPDVYPLVRYRWVDPHARLHQPQVFGADLPPAGACSSTRSLL